MKSTIIALMAVCAVLATCVDVGFAQETGESELTEFKRLVTELKEQMLNMEQKHQQDMLDMEQKHQQQIQLLKEQLKQLKEKSEAIGRDQPDAEDEAALLRSLAESTAGVEPAEEVKPPEETVFKYVGLSLQKLNPEISVSGDLLANYTDQSGTRRRADIEIRGLELNFQSYLDPFSRIKATAHISDDGVELEEVYMTRFSVLGDASLDLGRFRQQFGVVNRWHEDALDQVQYPLALRNIFGDCGLHQTGASLDFVLPEWGTAYQGLTVQVTNSENDRLFDGETLGNPSMLLHYNNYRDLSPDTYLELGLSGLFGWSDEWNVMDQGSLVTDTDSLGTQVYGVDLSMLWEPLDRALYRKLEWRSELYFLNRDILAPDGSGRDTLNAWGAYSYLQTKLGRSVEAGIRGDYYKPDSKDYAAVPGASLAPLAYTDSGPYRWQVGPYLTWWQSEFVKYRLEYDYADGEGMENAAHTLWLQAIFAAGPHKHERY